MKLSISKNPISLLFLLSLLLLSLTSLVSASPDQSPPETSSDFDAHIAAASKALQQSAYTVAIQRYSDALLIQPESLSTLFKRAHVFISIGRTAQALKDLEKVISINPDFHQARLQIVKLNLKEGDFEQTQSALDSYAKFNSNDKSTAAEIRQSLQTARTATSQAQEFSIKGNLEKAIELSTEALIICPNSKSLRDLRLDALIQLGKYEDAITDLRRLSNLQPTDASLHLRLSHIQYLILGNSETALATLKQCLSYDPDNQQCHKAFKAFKAVQKDIVKARNFANDSKFSVAIGILLNKKDGLFGKIDALVESSAKHLPKSSKNENQSMGLKVSAYSIACRSLVVMSDKRFSAICASLLKMDPEDPDALIGQSEDLIKEENYEQAVRVLEKCFQGRGQGRADVNEKLGKARGLLKISKTKDYYKVLGVSRDATTRQIKKAYRKLAKSNHPDKKGSISQMQDLNEAFEVLSDPEKRSVFDSGVDPNSAEYQQHQQHQQQGFNGFQHFQGFQGFQHPFFGSNFHP